MEIERNYLVGDQVYCLINGEKVLCRVIGFNDNPRIQYIIEVVNETGQRFYASENVGENCEILGRKCVSNDDYKIGDEVVVNFDHIRYTSVICGVDRSAGAYSYCVQTNSGRKFWLMDDCGMVDKDYIVRKIDTIKIPKIKKVTQKLNNTIIKFSDGTYTQAKPDAEDCYKPDVGVAMCIAKRVVGDYEHIRALADSAAKFEEFDSLGLFTSFIFGGKKYMKLPEGVCCGIPVNAICMGNDGKNGYKHFPINTLVELIHDCDSNEYLGDEDGEKNDTGLLED